MTDSSGFRLPEPIEVVFVVFLTFLMSLSVIYILSVSENTVTLRIVIATAALIVVCVIGAMIFRGTIYHIGFSAGHVLTIVVGVLALQGEYPLIEFIFPLSFFFPIALRFSALIASVSSLVVIALGIISHYSGNFLHQLLIGAIHFGVAGISILFVEYRERLSTAVQEVSDHKRSLKNLTAASHSFITQMEQIEAKSEERERLRITRELHDVIGYSMTSISMMMNASKYLLHQNPVKLVEYCERTKELSGETLRETRNILYKFREIGKANRPPLPVFFGRLCKDFQKSTGITTECHIGNINTSVNEPIFNALFRTVQVCFINALRHGLARNIRLFVWDNDETLNMSIWNDDKSSMANAVISQGIGLTGVQERLDNLGGKLTANPVDDGFKVKIEIPL
ncbi:MAG: hypothetical protein HN368_08645 [Spirochaetales bacterium]|nr:hypothetical protein [Spirochaetales bacterium]